ncbi:hypothetical protein CEUSTIGMA_g13114.t1 [Chlamydomonas eustigma]|uniref:ATP-dependent RNA helicase n=1 Tax=Chlamydomonas eustigma TaxID=1157962 RepID=A0A250XSC1_9CHLO|nr:hypothetical protein CEUSTIGMA_g13114.t1 [Chlamydomonas eustigma]|eukprot:GAX85700.1 hypothetical protein CEUSTIGMA_g13114.t1 [Chlamydomonas eustigma]
MATLPAGKREDVKQQKKHRRNFVKQLNKRSIHEDLEIKQLEEAIAAGAPASGSNSLSLPENNGDTSSSSYASARSFDDLPISEYTKEGLLASKYVTLTAIQRAALPHAIAGRDVLGAAKTGSGKTLTFLIPVVEKLYRLKWTRRDGLGGLILTPTRELALQIFEELRKIGKYHELSAGLLIGGKDVKEEQEAVSAMNILVATPGRLLQHMDETPGFDASGLQVLVLDEADRILDMGFSSTLDAILDNLPQSRQTLLFSATQTKSVKDLARLSLSNPEYLSVHSDATASTPLKLDQAYAVVPLQHKMDVVWGFIKSHLHAKTIVFLSTCKQVRFVHEAFRRLRPGVPLRALHGGMKQFKRMGVFYEFCEAKAMVLFATDIAARGLDFPTVDWVLQMDCPEDAHAYIHRVGRTARYMASGKALLLVTPGEKDGILEDLRASKIPIKQTKINPGIAHSVGPALQALLSKSTELKEYAQRSLIAYVRSVFLQPNKKVFDVTQLPAEEYAQSLGLITAPKLRFLKKVGKHVQSTNIGGRSADIEALLDYGSSPPSSGRAAMTSGRNELKNGITDDEPLKPQLPARLQISSRSEHIQPALRIMNKAADNAEHDEEEDDLFRVKVQDVFSDEVGAATTASTSFSHPATTTVMPRHEDDRPSAGDAEDSHLYTTAVTSYHQGLQNPVYRNALAAAGTSRTHQQYAGAGRKKIRIKAGKATGVRVVFDDGGEVLDPLALLASNTKFGSSYNGQATDDGSRDGVEEQGVYVVREIPNERFKCAADILRRRDLEDKARVKEQKLEERARKKARNIVVP